MEKVEKCRVSPKLKVKTRRPYGIRRVLANVEWSLILCVGFSFDIRFIYILKSGRKTIAIKDHNEMAKHIDKDMLSIKKSKKIKYLESKSKRNTKRIQTNYYKIKQNEIDLEILEFRKKYQAPKTRGSTTYITLLQCRKDQPNRIIDSDPRITFSSVQWYAFEQKINESIMEVECNEDIKWQKYRYNAILLKIF
ncbi:hypothetical protein AGLY_004913 [Aphis glycines]|uniref:Uncharacterized protein n=1 Tax=Aphis glycines TaxID=307491 RepID=A0A6G0TVD4_APHGL|nr:hypothetical protein AGLY_004913 [Aphis glycines]